LNEEVSKLQEQKSIQVSKLNRALNEVKRKAKQEKEQFEQRNLHLSKEVHHFKKTLEDKEGIITDLKKRLEEKSHFFRREKENVHKELQDLKTQVMQKDQIIEMLREITSHTAKNVQIQLQEKDEELEKRYNTIRDLTRELAARNDTIIMKNRVINTLKQEKETSLELYNNTKKMLEEFGTQLHPAVVPPNPQSPPHSINPAITPEELAPNFPSIPRPSTPPKKIHINLLPKQCKGTIDQEHFNGGKPILCVSKIDAYYLLEDLFFALKDKLKKIENFVIDMKENIVYVIFSSFSEAEGGCHYLINHTTFKQSSTKYEKSSNLYCQRLLIGNVPTVNLHDLETELKLVGSIKNFIKEHQSDSKSIAIVLFDNVETAVKAAKIFQGKLLGGSSLRVFFDKSELIG